MLERFGAQPITNAPRDGTVLRLLVDYKPKGTHPIDDARRYAWTIGFNNAEIDYDDDEWHIAGWDWDNEHFTNGSGKPVGWLPLISEG